MPIEQTRIEAACRAVYGKTWDGPTDKMPGPEMKDVWRKHVSKILAGGFPELASGPPDRVGGALECHQGDD